MSKNILGGIAIILAVAATGSHAATQQNRTVTGVGCGANGTCFANITPAADTTCTNPNQVRWGGTDAAGKNFTASMLTAKAAELPVTIGTIDNQCTGAFAQVNFITVN